MSKCKKCENLQATLGWSGYVQISNVANGKILPSPYIDRLLNPEFYPLENSADENIDCWPTCPDCQKPLQPDGDLSQLQNANFVDITPAMLIIGTVFLGILLLLIL
jgi:hypothetical protein